MMPLFYYKSVYHVITHLYTMLLHYTAVSPPAGFDEKTAIFHGKKFGLLVPAPGEDMASPLHHRGGKLLDKREFGDGLRLCWGMSFIPQQSLGVKCDFILRNMLWHYRCMQRGLCRGLRGCSLCYCRRCRGCSGGWGTVGCPLRRWLHLLRYAVLRQGGRRS